MSLLAVAVGGRGVVDPAEPVLRADDEALLRGRAAFETIRVYGGRPFKLAEHLDRLAGSAERIGLPAVNRLELEQLAQQALDAAESPDAVLRLYWTPTPVSIALVSALADHYDDLRARGQKLISLRGVRADEPWLLPGVKSTSYAVNMAAEAEARRRGADDAVFVDADATVLEGPTTNVWWRRDAHALHALARPRHPRRRDAGDGARARGRLRLRGRGGPLRPDGVAGGGRGVHLVVGARGDAGDRARRRTDFTGPGGRRAPGRAQAGSRGYASRMSDKIRLGGMALPNGVLVHGPNSWACAIRNDDGEIKVASARKRLFAPSIQQPFVRGPLRLAESFAMLPELRRKLPEARLPFERPSVIAATIMSAFTVQAVRRSPRLGSAARELLSGALSLAPAMMALRGGELAAYHGAEHISIGTYEHGEKRAKEHERCGSHLVGPLLVASAAGNLLASRAPAHLRRPARTASSIGAVGVAVEVFAWMTRHPGHPLARALAKPGHELQHRVATAEPTPDQLEVAEAALAACLELEHGDRAGS